MLILDVIAGDAIDELAERAQDIVMRLATDSAEDVSFVYNGVTLTATTETTAAGLVQEYYSTILATGIDPQLKIIIAGLLSDAVGEDNARSKQYYLEKIAGELHIDLPTHKPGYRPDQEGRNHDRTRN